MGILEILYYIFLTVYWGVFAFGFIGIFIGAFLCAKEQKEEFKNE
jgi:uncharacterized protein YneF (UPF0154 family)